MHARRTQGPHRGAALLLAGLVLCLAIAGTAIAAGPYEPNDTQRSAYGPLVNGRTYDAASESIFSPTDEDWYVLEGRRKGGTIDVAYTNLQAAGNCFGPEARLLAANGTSLGSVHPARNVTEHITYRASRGARYYLKVTPYPVIPCEPTDSPYRFVVTGIGRDPRLSGKGRLGADGLTVTGSILRGAPLKLIRVTAGGKTTRAHSTKSAKGAKARGKKRRFEATVKLPKSARGAKSLSFEIVFRGSSDYGRAEIKGKASR